MNKITLGQLLQYYDLDQNPVDRIQIVSPEHNWKDADELSVDSILLKEFCDWNVIHMGIEKTFADSEPALRVLIEPAKKTGSYKSD